MSPYGQKSQHRGREVRNFLQEDCWEDGSEVEIE